MKILKSLQLKTLSSKLFVKLTIVIAITIVASQCSWFDKSKTYWLTNKLDGKDRSMAFNKGSGSEIVIKDSADDEAQYWKITPEGENYYIRNVLFGSKESLEVKDDKSDIFVGMALTAKDDGQMWAISPVGDD